MCTSKSEKGYSLCYLFAQKQNQSHSNFEIGRSKVLFFAAMAYVSISCSSQFHFGFYEKKNA